MKRPRHISLENAIATHVQDGMVLALEGFTHLIPFAAGHEIIRQGRRDLTLIRMTPDVLYDQMVGAGCAAKLVFSYAGNPGAGLLRRVRDAVENHWPRPLELEEHSHAAMAHAWEAGASGMPFAAFKGYRGAELASINRNIRSVRCPFTDEIVAAVPALNPDVGIIHAQCADEEGNVLVEGIVGVQKECLLASRIAIATVEERIDTLRGRVHSNACVIPSWCVDAICVVPDGARPSYASGYYDRDNVAYRDWDVIASDRDRFETWLTSQIFDHAARDVLS